MTLPSFVLVGVPKAGTKSLYHYLRDHPQVAVSDLPEINFLSYPGPEEAKRTVPWLRFSVTDLDQYRSLFAHAGDRVPVDLSASCFGSDVAIERIRRFVPDAKLFVLLRDPVERAYSAYLHRLRKGYEQRSPEEALVPGERTVELGRYSRRFEAFVDAFGPERVRAWLLDDLRQRPGETMAEIFAYLGVDPDVPINASTIHNPGSVPRRRVVHRLFLDHRARRRLAKYTPRWIRRPAEWLWERNQVAATPLSDELESRLHAHYRDDIRRLEDILDRDLSSWLRPGIELAVED